MDVSRYILDSLMGKDRNKTADQITSKDHYSNRDVCKSFLICFCFDTLFPNTVYDEGPCKLRHDPFLKNMFDADPNRVQYQKQYLAECIAWIEKRLGDVQNRIKKNQGLIENKSSYVTERPKEIVDKLIQIDKEIEETMGQAETFGENGQVVESEKCMVEVERLREKRKEIEAMGDSMVNAQKQQKICEICGAIQTINDTEKRIQTHLEGKIHQGFLKLRHYIENLRIRLNILNNIDGKKTETREKPEREAKKSRSRSHRKKSRSRGKQAKKEKDKKERSREREHREKRDRSRSKDRHKKKHKHHDRSRSKERH